MCGIAGLAGTGAADLEALGRMADAMAKRGPDGQGIWSDGDVGFAFRRLSIIDLHERSNQPLHYGSLHLVFNGEIYNYIELRQELRHLGHAFTTEGDAEVLLRAWAEWGEDALQRLNGMFAIAVWDADFHVLTLAVDRFAEKPLLLHARRDQLAFASSAFALRAADRARAMPDLRAAARFLAVGVTPDLPSTFYSDLKRLAPAHLAQWSADRGLRVRRWWEPRHIDTPREPAAAAARLRELLNESVRLRLRSDVPVGTSLSGGVDSSAVVALTARLSPQASRHAFTATFSGFERDEWQAAAEVAQVVGVDCHHAVCPSADELFSDLPMLVRDQEEPFGGTSIYAQWRVMRCAREAGVVVLLDGQGADELFGGYPEVAGWALRSRGLRHAITALARDHALAEPLAIAYAAGRTPRALARRHRMRMASPYVEPHVMREAGGHGGDRLLAWTAGDPPLRRELLTQALRTSLPMLCRFADRDSMAFSVEVRLPFLDPAIADFAFSLPAELLWNHGVTKRVLRDSMVGLVPPDVLRRREKVRFETPEHLWLGSRRARERIAEILLDRDVRGPHLRNEVQRDLTAGRWRDTSAIWRALNVELWLQAVGESVPG